MKITVIGTGYVGLVTAACLAEQGNTVLCLDIDKARIGSLQDGVLPIYEPGLKELFDRNRDSGRLAFTDDTAASVAHGDLQFIAVGTPPDEDGSADLKHVLAAAENIGRHMENPKVVVDKSTVPVGTAEKVAGTIAAALKRRNRTDISAVAVSNPEFLKEGAAISDFMRPDRIVIGVDGHTPDADHARMVMRTLYAPFNRNHDRIIMMDVRSAEFTKYAANAMLATRISFMNELANLADKVGVDIEMVRQGIGSDSRIGYSFLYAGTGYGGSCFPKDVQALQHAAGENGVSLGILKAVEVVNHRQKHVLVSKITNRFGADLSGKRFAVWGLAFKPETNDMRDAPSREIIRELTKRGAAISAHDPVAMPEARQCLEEDLLDIPGAMQRVEFAGSPMAALEGGDALVIVTEWKPFKGPDFDAVKVALRTPLIFDGRNLYDPHLMRKLGIEYHAIGRSNVARTA